MAYKPKPTPAARIRRARKIGRDALIHANVVAGNEALARSTRSRTIYKIKADALHNVLSVLDGEVVV